MNYIGKDKASNKIELSRISGKKMVTTQHAENKHTTA